MTPPRDLPHLRVTRPPRVDAYKPHPVVVKPRIIKVDDRPGQGAALSNALSGAQANADQRRAAAGFAIPGARRSLYVEFVSRPEIPLDIEALGDARAGIEVVNVRIVGGIERATVIVPEGKVGYFLDRFATYAKPTPKKFREVRYEGMIDPIATLHLATLKALWTEEPNLFPADTDTVWWEVWLRRTDGNELSRLGALAGRFGMEVSARRLQFDDRIVVLVQARAVDLAASIAVMDDLAELRLPKTTAAEFIDNAPFEQAEWTLELQERLRSAPADAPRVCVLDTGVTRGHPLLDASLSEAECLTCEAAWGTDDREGHGTGMAGLALFGDLAPVLARSGVVQLLHRLESVKVLPPPPKQNKPELFGAITAAATQLAEEAAPGQQRVFSLAVTAGSADLGQPTSWSATLDALAMGRSLETSSKGLVYLDDWPEPKLFVVSAGNVQPENLAVAHLDRSDIDPVQDPAQAWNVLTVGACTDLGSFTDPTYDGWQPIAAVGELSPWSTTSVAFDRSWPMKPEVVFEGGNLLRDPENAIDYPIAALSLLTTHHKPQERAFELSWATSAATAQVARIAAMIWAEYPWMRPETVRALIVHSARWTPRMEGAFLESDGKQGRGALLRRYGYGKPDYERAIRSARNGVSLLVEGTIKPFREGKMRELNVHELPWPQEELVALGAARVRMRVTLSYFVEPNPSRTGWRTRHRYASHGLRFEVKRPTESVADLRKRLNQAALEESEKRPKSDSDGAGWFLGSDLRKKGSIHSDCWTGTAAELAARGAIAVVPKSGWWKDQPARDRSEHGVAYSLIVSVELDDLDVDIWTPLCAEVGVEAATVIVEAR